MHSGMARVLTGSHSFSCTPRVHPPTEWTIPAFPFQPKLVLIYRPRREGRLSWPGWLVTYRNRCPSPGIITTAAAAVVVQSGFITSVDNDTERHSIYQNVLLLIRSKTGILNAAVFQDPWHNFNEITLHQKYQLIQAWRSSIVYNSLKIHN